MMSNEQLHSRVVSTLYLLSALVILFLSIQNYRYGLYDLVYSGSVLAILFIGASAYAQFSVQANLLNQVSLYVLIIVSLIIIFDSTSNAAEIKHWAYPVGLLSFTCISHRQSMILSGALGACISLMLWSQNSLMDAIAFAATFALLVSLASTYAQLHQQRNRTLVELEIRDSLTGSYNYRHLEDTLKKEICRADRTGRPLSLIALEIDYFPQFNDMHGNTAVKNLNQELAETLRAMIRAGDSSYHKDDSLFYLLLPCTPSERGTGNSRAH